MTNESNKKSKFKSIGIIAITSIIVVSIIILIMVKSIKSISTKYPLTQSNYLTSNNMFEEFKNKDKHKIHFITYSNKKYEKAKKRILKEAKDFGQFDTITGYGPNDLDNKFKKKFKNILNKPRGGGYWIWKPYILYKKFKEIKDNDYLVYLDAGCKFNKKGINRFNEYINLLSNSKYGILSFQMSHIENEFTIKEIFEYFNSKVDCEHGNSGQFIATVIIIKKNQHSKMILETYLKALFNNSLMFTDYFNKNSQASFFKDNRHDQSVFSLIRKIYGSVVIDRDETYVIPWGSEQSLKYPFWAIRNLN